jgi:hypothetical protein
MHPPEKFFIEKLFVLGGNINCYAKNFSLMKSVARKTVPLLTNFVSLNLTGDELIGI